MRGTLAFLLLVGIGVSSLALGEEAEEYVVVVSPDVAVSNLTQEELRNIFMFRKQFWSAGRPITILIAEEDLGSDSFLLAKIYEMEYKFWKRFVFQKLYQGDIDLAPKIVASGETTVGFVASGSGLVALVKADRAKGAQVKVLTIDGKAPGSQAYPLRR